MSMAAQTSYNFGFSKGVAGGLYDLSDHGVVTRQAEGSTTFGLGVVTGTNRGIDVSAPTSENTSADFEGIIVHNSVMTELDMDNRLEIKAGRTVGCLSYGKVWVKLAPGAEPEYKNTAYLVKDGEYAGCFTSRQTAYAFYEKCGSSDSGALHIVADTSTPTDGEIKISDVSAQNGYTPAIGDYVCKNQVYGAGLDVGAKFWTAADPENGIAVILVKGEMA